MEFSCPKADLLAAAQVVARVVPATSSEPVFLNVLLSLDDGLLTLFATDNRVFVRHHISVKQVSGGRIAILGHLLLEILGALQSSRSIDASVKVTPEGRVVFNSADAMYNLAGFPGDSFPVIAEPTFNKTFHLPAHTLRELIKKTTVVTGSGSGGMQTYEEVLVESQTGELCFVATDSVRLAIRSLKLGAELPPFRVLVPSHALQELGRLLKADQDVEIALADDQVRFTLGTTEVRARLSDKTFPNFRNILPRQQSRTVVMRSQEFQDNLRGVIPLAKDTKNKVYLEFDHDRVILTSTSPELGEARREVEAVLTGEPIKLGFNGKYLLDFLSVVDCEKFRWGVTSATYPATLSPDADDAGYTYVLMPITH